MRLRRWIPFSALGISLIFASVDGLAQSLSHARIVRLSFVEGTVTVQRADLSDWGAAPVNTPIQEGFKISTAENSFAEAQFENGSTARLGQLALLEFNQLALTPAGSKINRMTLHRGYATFSFRPEQEDVYEVKTGDTTLRLTGGAHTIFRVDIDPEVTRVEVFKGGVEVSSPFGSETLAKDMRADLHPGAEQPLEVATGISKDAWDEWVEQREDQEALPTRSGGSGNYPYQSGSSFYGWNDLSWFGSWGYFPGFGYGWSPYLSAGWVPYSFGRWVWYPGFGFTWVSYEPWGWLPYHFGSWSYIPGFGWNWFPGSFGTWCPALVTWYQGPGWVGWAPRSPQGTGYAGSGPVAALPLDNFRNGRPVGPGALIPADFSRVRPVASPDVTPARLAMLPGDPVAAPAATIAGGQKSQWANMPLGGPGQRVLAPSTPPVLRTGALSYGPGSSQTGIVYDPTARRFVNSPNAVSGSLNSPAESPVGKSDSSSNRSATPGAPTLVAPSTAGPQTAKPSPSPASGVAPTARPAPSPSVGPRADSPSRSPSASSPRTAPSASRGNSGGSSSVRSSSASSWGSGSFGGGRSSGGLGSGGGGIGGGGHSSGGHR